MIAVLAFAGAVLSGGFAPSGTPQVTVASLLDEMVDRDAIAKTSNPSFKLAQASSYDRARTDPKNPSTWFSNNDQGQFIRTEQRNGKTEWVIMDSTEPGAITRFWTPLDAAKDGMIVRFYFDGATLPNIEVPFNDFLRGRTFIKPPFAYIAWPDAGTSSVCGGEMYFPIPFAKGCKVTTSEVPAYYAIDYRVYPAGTAVQTFAGGTLDADASLIARTASALASYAVGRHNRIALADATVSPRQVMKLELPRGPAAAYQLILKVPKGVDSQSLRSTVLEMTFDGERTVWCPIGDFFGCGIHLREVQDWYRKVAGDGTLTCNWVMPYRKSAVVRVLNCGSGQAHISLKAKVEPWTWNLHSMLFHAGWHHQYPLATRPMSDWNYLEATGKGVYAGDTLTVMSPSPAWYGEGDEKVYVDGETFPSEIGTGTEDYYGYGWGMAEHFSSPFIAMPMRDHTSRGDWTGFTTTSRVRLLDDIPFQRSLKFDMEIWHWADCKVEYSVATFWYARPGATTNRAPAPTEAAAPIPEWRTIIKGAIECESMPITAKSEGLTTEMQGGGLTEGTWSGSEQLFVHGTRVGDFVELRVPVKRPGRRRLILYATKSYDYGIVRIGVNGKAVKEIDLYSPQPIATGAIDLGEFDVRPGSLTLRVETIGTNSKSTGSRYYFGLDCIVLKQ